MEASKRRSKGGLAGTPQRCLDPILAASASVISLQNIISREVDPLDSQVESNTEIQLQKKDLQDKSFNTLILMIDSVCGLSLV